jgi:alkaline phosphatase D
MDERPGPGRSAWTDAWDGYPAARRRVLEALAQRPNAVTIGGDIHAFNVSALKLDFDDAKAPVIGSEFVGTSITSQGWAQKRFDSLRADNPHMVLADSRYRGYVRMELTPGVLKADLRAMEGVHTREAACSTLASFIVEDGKPGPQRA